MRSALIALVIVAAAGPATAQDRLAEQLRKGIAQEEASQDLAGAIQTYRAIVAQYDQQRPTAAAALYRLAECSRKAGRREQAVAAYRRIVREFGEQTSMVGQSRQQLATLGAAEPTATAAERSTAEARAQDLKMERQLAEDRLRELKKRGLAAPSQQLPREVGPERGTTSPEETKLEIEALRARMEDVRKRVGAGQAAPVDLKSMEIDYRILQQRYEQQLMARQADIELTENMMRSVEAEILLVEQQIKAMEARVGVGTMSAQSPELFQLKRDLLSLQRKFAELRAGLKR